VRTYTNPVFEYRRPPELDGARRRYPVAVIGAGPVGLVAAIDLAQRDVPVVVLDEDNTVSVGSRAICYAKRTLEILDRLGCGEDVVQKGVRWSVGRVFHGSELTYQFDLLPETGHRRPAFVNLQQYHFEECLVRRAEALAHAELRWRHKVIDVAPSNDGVTLRVATPDGEYALTCDWLIVADGARSPVRHMLGLDTEGQVFHDRFLIADIHMTSDFPAERWFWFDPPFHPNQSALLHRQADNVWRVDFQLGWDADPDEEKKPERILPRLRAMLGAEAKFEIEWASVYTFACRRMRKFRHGRVLFAGDAAHLVSPFGARGANGGVQDVDNLIWKLDLVLKGLASDCLLDSYDVERVVAADENIRNSTRSTEFITPKSTVSRTFRDAVLSLAKKHPFARRLVNSGRLSVPAVLRDSPLNTPDRDADFAKTPDAMVPGAPAADAPVTALLGARVDLIQGSGAATIDAPVSLARGDWLLSYLIPGFTLLTFGDAVPVVQGGSITAGGVACGIVQVGSRAQADRTVISDKTGLVERRYDGRPGTSYLLRPDQHVCARWRAFDAGAVRRAMDRAMGAA